MQMRIVTLRYDEEIKGFSDDELQSVIDGRRILNVSDHFFVRDNIPHLTLVLAMCDETPTAAVAEQGEIKDKESSAEEALTDESTLVLNALREWRNETAKGIDKPAYVVAHNKQLMRIAKTIPRTVAELKDKAKMSDSFCDRYGEQVIGVVLKTMGKTVPSEVSKHWWNIGG